MESALIVASHVSYTDEGAAFYSEVLSSASIKQVTVLHSSGDAKRLLLKQDFDLVIVDAPLPDESGESLSRHIVSRDASPASPATQVILVTEKEFFNRASVCENDGVIVILRPMDKNALWLALKFAGSTQSRLRRIQEENSRLKKKIDDLRIIDRAKYTLISYLSMSEHEAHRFIEKQAMDMRSTRRSIAEEILKTYAN